MANCEHPEIGYIAWELNDYPAQLVESIEGFDYYRINYSEGELCDSRESRFYCLVCNETITGVME